jgi:uncharacterized membrane protein YqaE (UPF0057 family)
MCCRFIAAVILPPLGVWLEVGCNKTLCLNILLTLLIWCVRRVVCVLLQRASSAHSCWLQHRGQLHMRWRTQSTGAGAHAWQAWRCLVTLHSRAADGVASCASAAAAAVVCCWAPHCFDDRRIPGE